jgi:acetylornithine deacetylase/succinyl-diaminopimelate desuccinylase-like protein
MVRGVVERTVELARIPAPTSRERRRAEVVAGWWKADGWPMVSIDGAGNVWARVGSGDGASVVVCAHLDTVFDEDVDHTPTLDGDRLRGPGVGDDSVAVAALSAVGRLIDRQSGHRPVWLLATVGEEGLGNLAGIRWALEHRPGPMAALIAVEGNYLGRVATTGVGSLRLQVTLTGPGGHAWERADAPNVVHEAARVVAGLAALEVVPGRRSVNVGTFAGGETINARSRHATFAVDLRSSSAKGLDALEREAEVVLGSPLPEGVALSTEVLGRRPAGGIGAVHPLVRAATAALERAGIDPLVVAASTDANAAFAAGIPAVSLGITVGAGEHTVEEWIDLRPIARGLVALADTVAIFERESDHA